FNNDLYDLCLRYCGIVLLICPSPDSIFFFLHLCQAAIELAAPAGPPPETEMTADLCSANNGYRVCFGRLDTATVQRSNQLILPYLAYDLIRLLCCNRFWRAYYWLLSHDDRPFCIATG